MYLMLKTFRVEKSFHYSLPVMLRCSEASCRLSKMLALYLSMTTEE